VNGGVDPISVAHLMGHRDTSMVAKVYSHIAKNPEFLRKQARAAIHSSGRRENQSGYASLCPATSSIPDLSLGLSCSDRNHNLGNLITKAIIHSQRGLGHLSPLVFKTAEPDSIRSSTTDGKAIGQTTISDSSWAIAKVYRSKLIGTPRPFS